MSDEWVQLIVAHDWVDRRNGEKFVTQFVANLTVTGGGAFDGDASDVPFTPATEGDWGAVPAQVAEALDELAAGGGGGAVDSVNGQTGVVVLDAGDVGALDASSGYNTVNGWLKLDGSGTAPDSTIPASIARDSEVSAAVSAHAGATDPHGDRAYAAGLVDDLSGVTNAATARSNLGLGNVDNTSDANKPVSSAQQTALDGKAATSHSHSGSDITSGTVATARLGSGTASAAKVLAGDQSWKDGVFGDGTVTTVKAMTQAAYDALGTPDAYTLYVVTP